jgi:hypothetical protein
LPGTVADRLADHIANLKIDINASTVHRFMGLLRELLEERGKRKALPLLTMFCDWSVHTKLDRSQAGDELLDILDASWATSTTVDQQIAQLLGDISPLKLQTQICSLLTASFIDPSIIGNVASCARIFEQMIDDLKGKTVARRADRLKKITAERLSRGYRFVADRFYFEDAEAGDGIIFVLIAKQIEASKGGEVLIKIPWQIIQK